MSLTERHLDVRWPVAQSTGASLVFRQHLLDFEPALLRHGPLKQLSNPRQTACGSKHVKAIDTVCFGGPGLLFMWYWSLFWKVFFVGCSQVNSAILSHKGMHPWKAPENPTAELLENTNGWDNTGELITVQVKELQIYSQFKKNIKAFGDVWSFCRAPLGFLWARIPQLAELRELREAPRTGALIVSDEEMLQKAIAQRMAS